ncbi:MAG: hypothetical protein IT435_02325 [Phycisphaerales bacterium]|nr:hypothetical protein [Phycisphaerales bacterium]
MELELTYNAATEIPKGFESLYTEQGGKFVLTGVKGLAGLQAERTRFETSLSAEKKAHAATKAERDAAQGKIAEAETARDEALASAEAAGKGGKIDEAKLTELADKRAALKIGPLQKQLDAANAAKAEADKALADALGRERAATIRTELGTASAKAGVHSSMQEAAILMLSPNMEVGEDGKPRVREGAALGLTPGLDPIGAFNELKTKAPGFWATSEGGGSKGGGTMQNGEPNPFSKDHWNVTKQMALSDADAQRMAKAAGVDFKNPVRPTK